MLEIISPHIDDASLSLGSLTLQMNADDCAFEITSCFSISDYHTGLDALERSEVTRIRKTEDSHFSRLLNSKIKFNYLDFLDAPLRGYEKCTFKNSFNAADELLINRLHGYLKQKKNQQYLIPLGLGQHIDHVISLHAACLLAGNKIAAFYEDLPYAGRLTHEEIVDYIRIIERRTGFQLTPVVVGSQFINRKEEICNLYTSQLKDWYVEKIRESTTKHNGERIWVVNSKNNELLHLLGSI